MNRQRGWGVVGNLIAIAIVLAMMAGAWAIVDRTCWTTECKRMELERDQAVTAANNWRDVAAEQNAAIDATKRAAAARVAKADLARKDAEALVKMHTEREAALLAVKPTVEGDPCASACYLLRQPL